MTSSLPPEQSAAGILRRARYAAVMTQRELARAAHVPQSVVSAYEKGRREPSVRMLRALVHAARHELVLSLEESTGDGNLLGGHHGPRVLEHWPYVVEGTSDLMVLTRLVVVGRVAAGTDGPFDPVELLVEVTGGLSVNQATSIRGLAGLWFQASVEVTEWVEASAQQRAGGVDLLSLSDGGVA